MRCLCKIRGRDRLAAPDRAQRKAWELVRMFCALFSPSRDFMGFVSEYLNEVATRGSAEIQSLRGVSSHDEAHSKRAMRCTNRPPRKSSRLLAGKNFAWLCLS